MKYQCLHLAVFLLTLYSVTSLLSPKRLTLVTAIWHDEEATWKQLQQTFKLIKDLNFNLYVVMRPQLTKIASILVNSNKISIIQIDKQEIDFKLKWLTPFMENENQSLPAYMRLFFLKKVVQFDRFDSDQLFWVDLNYFLNPMMAEFFKNQKTNELMQKKYHFFFLTEEDNVDKYKFVGSEQTYFNVNFTNLANPSFFGGKIQSIQTIALIYEDILKVVLIYDKKNWSEQEIYTILADRTPFLISYLTLIHQNKNESNPSRFLQESNQNSLAVSFDETQYSILYQKTTLKRILKLINLIIIGLIIYSIIQFFKKIKVRLTENKLQNQHFEVEPLNA